MTSADIEIPNPPSDSISSLSFSGKADYLAVGSWDNSVRVYELSPQGQSQGRAMYSHQAPVLSVCWNEAGNQIFSGGVDAGFAFDIATGQTTQFAQHDGPIKVVKWVNTPHTGLVVTGSWDKTIKYWDLRTPTPVATVNLSERCYTLDAHYPLMVVGTADRQIHLFDLAKSTTPYKTMTSPLKLQTRVVSCCHPSDKAGFAVGSIEGRVAFHYVEEKNRSYDYSFRCIKDQSLIYSVNDINFHPVHGTFTTCGSDGTIHFWDKDARMRLKSFNRAPGPIVCSTFNSRGSIFAYAVAYDWYKGHSGMADGHPNKLMLHAVKDEDVQKRAPRR
ncbi:Poly(A)+ RNA export protein [Rhodocollybia butyracea]|uniref:Poly(A)+ RNA export protein n=1 Tax=Rhodocollybia butyracea TaxID=206335 RepID=A0A9P5U2V7_9AGAR|nr:Poly(A)+ RNA export protein [Rhodocollybia butyracea]